MTGHIWLRHRAVVHIASQSWTIISLARLEADDIGGELASARAAGSVRAVLNIMFPGQLEESVEVDSERVGIDAATDDRMLAYFREQGEGQVVTWTYWFPTLASGLWGGANNGRQQ